MNHYEGDNSGTTSGQSWDMSDVAFAGAEKQAKKEKLSKALEDAPKLLLCSEIFGGNGGRINGDSEKFIHAVGWSNDKLLDSIRELDGGRYKINYGTDVTGKGFTGLGQVSGALDYFDETYGDSIDDYAVKGFMKMCIAMWPMGNVGSFGVHEFAKSAKIDAKTASLVNMMIDRNSMKLVEARFDKGDSQSGEKLVEINKNYLMELNNGQNSDAYEEDVARSVCNMQKILMDCERAGAKIAKERKINKQP